MCRVFLQNKKNRSWISISIRWDHYGTFPVFWHICQCDSLRPLINVINERYNFLVYISRLYSVSDWLNVYRLQMQWSIWSSYVIVTNIQLKIVVDKNTKAPRRNMQIWALNKRCHFVPCSLLSVAGILQFPFVRYFTWILWIFKSVSVSVAGNKMALGSVLLCLLRHTIMTSSTCALTQLFVPRRHLKSNTRARLNFKHTNFNLFRARLIKCTGYKQ